MNYALMLNSLQYIRIFINSYIFIEMQIQSYGICVFSSHLQKTKETKQQQQKKKQKNKKKKKT